MTSWREILASAAGDRDAGSWAITTHVAEGLVLAAGEGEAALRAAVAVRRRGEG